MRNGHALHVYFGQSKGKTTCAMGLAIRAAGQGKKVLVSQLMKTNTSGELNSLRQLDNITVVLGEPITKLTNMMSEQELAEEKLRQRANFEKICGEIRALKPDMIVLDELCVAEHLDFVDTERVLECIDEWLLTSEVVLTGHWASEVIRERADYVTEMVKCKHPYDEGVQARRGVEF